MDEKVHTCIWRGWLARKVQFKQFKNDKQKWFLIFIVFIGYQSKEVDGQQVIEIGGDQPEISVEYKLKSSKWHIPLLFLNMPSVSLRQGTKDHKSGPRH